MNPRMVPEFLFTGATPTNALIASLERLPCSGTFANNAATVIVPTPLILLSQADKVVRRLMVGEQLVSSRNRRHRYSSYCGEIGPAPDNLLTRDFKAAKPNQKWLSPWMLFSHLLKCYYPILMDVIGRSLFMVIRKSHRCRQRTGY